MAKLNWTKAGWENKIADRGAIVLSETIKQEIKRKRRTWRKRKSKLSAQKRQAKRVVLAPKPAQDKVGFKIRKWYESKE